MTNNAPENVNFILPHILNACDRFSGDKEKAITMLKKLVENGEFEALKTVELKYELHLSTEFVLDCCKQSLVSIDLDGIISALGGLSNFFSRASYHRELFDIIGFSDDDELSFVTLNEQISNEFKENYLKPLETVSSSGDNRKVIMTYTFIAQLLHTDGLNIITDEVRGFGDHFLLKFLAEATNVSTYEDAESFVGVKKHWDSPFVESHFMFERLKALCADNVPENFWTRPELQSNVFVQLKQFQRENYDVNDLYTAIDQLVRAQKLAS